MTMPNSGLAALEPHSLAPSLRDANDDNRNNFDLQELFEKNDVMYSIFHFLNLTCLDTVKLVCVSWSNLASKSEALYHIDTSDINSKDASDEQIKKFKRIKSMCIDGLSSCKLKFFAKLAAMTMRRLKRLRVSLRCSRRGPSNEDPLDIDRASKIVSDIIFNSRNSLETLDIHTDRLDNNKVCILNHPCHTGDHDVPVFPQLKSICLRGSFSALALKTTNKLKHLLIHRYYTHSCDERSYDRLFVDLIENFDLSSVKSLEWCESTITDFFSYVKQYQSRPGSLLKLVSKFESLENLTVWNGDLLECMQKNKKELLCQLEYLKVTHSVLNKKQRKKEKFKFSRFDFPNLKILEYSSSGATYNLINRSCSLPVLKTLLKLVSNWTNWTKSKEETEETEETEESVHADSGLDNNDVLSSRVCRLIVDCNLTKKAWDFFPQIVEKHGINVECLEMKTISSSWISFSLCSMEKVLRKVLEMHEKRRTRGERFWLKVNEMTLYVNDVADKKKLSELAGLLVRMWIEGCLEAKIELKVTSWLRRDEYCRDEWFKNIFEDAEKKTNSLATTINRDYKKNRFRCLKSLQLTKDMMIVKDKCGTILNLLCKE